MEYESFYEQPSPLCFNNNGIPVEEAYFGLCKVISRNYIGKLLFFYEMHVTGNSLGTFPYFEDGAQDKLFGCSFGNLTWWGHQVSPTIFIDSQSKDLTL